MNLKQMIVPIFFAIFITFTVQYFMNFIFNKFKIGQTQNKNIEFGKMVDAPKKNQTLNIPINSELNFDKKKIKKNPKY